MKTMLRNAILLCLVACMLMSAVTLSGCTVSIKAEELSATYVRTATEEGKVTDAFVAAMADFSMILANTTLSMDREKTDEPVTSMDRLVEILKSGECELICSGPAAKLDGMKNMPAKYER